MMAVNLAAVPSGVLIVLALLVLVEIGLDVFALVDLYRRPTERVAGGNKWVWVAVIVLVNLLGAILYLALARKPALAVEAPPAGRPAEQIGDIVDSLYGPRDNPDPK